MAAGKKIPARKKPRTRLAVTSAGDRLKFAEEYLRNAFGVLDELLSPEEKAEALLRAQSPRRRPAGAAKQYLERIQGLGQLLSQWRNQPPFVDKEGTPKVLPILGRGTTLEALARRHVPSMRVSEVIRILTRYSDVKRVKGKKVALLGTSLMLVPKSADYTLATITLSCQRYSRAILHNAKSPQQLGHFDRTAAEKLTWRRFNEWLKQDKERLQQQVVENEASLTRAAAGGRGEDFGVTTFAWFTKPPPKSR